MASAGLEPVLGKGVRPMGNTVKLEFKAQGPNGSRSPVPYISPPMICARPPGTNQGSQETETTPESSTGRY